jgi:mRNA interferase RelE/StbE
MTYRLTVLHSTDKKIARFPKDVIVAINRAVLALAENPRPHGCRKVRGQRDTWRLVVRKDYRVLYTVDDEARVVVVYDADRREKDTYRR